MVLPQSRGQREQDKFSEVGGKPAVDVKIVSIGAEEIILEVNEETLDAIKGSTDNLDILLSVLRDAIVGAGEDATTLHDLLTQIVLAESANIIGEVKLTDGTTVADIDVATKALKVFLANFLDKDNDTITTYPQSPDGAVLQQIVSVTTSATKLPATPLTDRQGLSIQNRGLVDLYWGSSSVTSDDAATGGQILPPGQSVPINVGPTVDVYGIVAAGTCNASVVEIASG